MCPSASCLVLTVLFVLFVSFFGGGEVQGLEVGVMDSLAFEFRGFFMVFWWVFGGGVEGG